MSPARRAATWLLAVLLTGTIGCHRGRSTSPLPASTRAMVYASVLAGIRPEFVAGLVVLDTLLPSTEVDAEQHDKVMSALSIDRTLLDTFLASQRHSGTHVEDRLSPDARWTLVTPRHIDSLRALARAETARAIARSNATVSQSVRANSFWHQWERQHPASGGYVVLSPAGLSSEGDAAIVQVQVLCGPVCGETELQVLRRDAGGAWRVAGRVRLSES